MVGIQCDQIAITGIFISSLFSGKFATDKTADVLDLILLCFAITHILCQSFFCPDRMFKLLHKIRPVHLLFHPGL